MGSPTDAALLRLVQYQPASWKLTLYPSAGEGGGAFVSSSQRRRTGIRGMPEDPERAKAEAARRARGKARRFCAANGLNRLGTLTYGPPFCTDHDQLRGDVARFFRKLRRLLGGEPLPYLWVPELHKDGVRFHVHFAVGRFVQRGLIQQAWPHGFVHIKLLSDLPVGSTRWDEARLAARYLAKYIGKDYGQHTFGRQRFKTAEGFAPKAERLEASTPEGLIAQASERMGRRPSYEWSSADAVGWQGPPALWLSW